MIVAGDCGLDAKTKRTAYPAIVILLACGCLLLAARHMSHSVWFDESQTDLIAHQDTPEQTAQGSGFAGLTMPPRPPPAAPCPRPN